MNILLTDGTFIENFSSSFFDGILVLSGSDKLNRTSLKIFEDGEEIYKEYKYKFNVLTTFPDAILLTNDPENVETEDNPASRYYVPITDNMKASIIEQKKKDLIESSKALLSDYLKENPLELTIAGHGTGFYTVTKEKQDQMFQTLSSYRTQKEFFPDAKILWNKSGEELEEWSEEDFLRLIREVNEYVQPRVKKQQKYEKDILAATTLEKLDELEDKINYKEV